MKLSTLSLIVFAMSIAGCTANAQNTHTVYANVTAVTPLVHYVNDSVPYQRCNNVQVPIYETRRNSSATAGDVLGGMILGGLIGKGATGNDDGAAVGAVIGGMLAADQHNRSTQYIVGYRQETQCQIHYQIAQREVVNGYNVYYRWNGLTGSTYSDTLYRVGDMILVQVKLN